MVNFEQKKGIRTEVCLLKDKKDILGMVSPLKKKRTKKDCQGYCWSQLPNNHLQTVYTWIFPILPSLTETSTSLARSPQLATALCVIYYICRTPQSQLAKRACFVHSWAVDSTETQLRRMSGREGQTDTACVPLTDSQSTVATQPLTGWFFYNWIDHPYVCFCSSQRAQPVDFPDF